jgi:hypothetical protein
LCRGEVCRLCNELNAILEQGYTKTLAFCSNEKIEFGILKWIASRTETKILNEYLFNSVRFDEFREKYIHSMRELGR